MAHPFRTRRAHYAYILTQPSYETTLIEGIGHTTAVAERDFDNIRCASFYKDCFNFLLMKDRPLEIWSDDPRIDSKKYTIRRGDDKEPHKHPVTFNKTIRKGEKVSWWYRTVYHLRNPTAERIWRLQRSQWWDSKKQPLFIFYWDVKDRLEEVMLEFYIPLWMKQYVFSKTYSGLRFDGKILNEKALQKKGVIIKRKNHAIKSMHVTLREEFRKYVHLPEERFYRISVVFSCTKKQKKPITITTGLRMPPAKEWQ